MLSFSSLCIFILKHRFLIGISIAILTVIVTDKLPNYFKRKNITDAIATSDTALTIKLYFSFV